MVQFWPVPGVCVCVCVRERERERETECYAPPTNLDVHTWNLYYTIKDKHADQLAKSLATV